MITLISVTEICLTSCFLLISTAPPPVLNIVLWHLLFLCGRHSHYLPRYFLTFQFHTYILSSTINIADKKGLCGKKGVFLVSWATMLTDWFPCLFAPSQFLFLDPSLSSPTPKSCLLEFRYTYSILHKDILCNHKLTCIHSNSCSRPVVPGCLHPRQDNVVKLES